MKWLSIGFRNVFWCMTLGAIVLGFLSVFPGAGHATAGTEGARAREAGTALSSAAVPLNTTVSTESRQSPAGCNEALDALALCALPKNSRKPSSNEEAGPGHQVVRQAPEHIASQKIVDTAKEVGGTPFPTLPVLAFSLAIAGALLAAFNFCAMSLKEGRDNSARQMVVRSLGFLGCDGNVAMGFLKKSPTAAIAKERLLQFPT